MTEAAGRTGRPHTAGGTNRILVMGMYRSGTTRLYNVVREALSGTYGDALMTGHHRESDLERLLDRPDPCVFKDHEPSAPVIDRILAGDPVAVGTVRAPLEAMVSFAATFDWTVDEIITRIDASVRSMERLAGRMIVLPYEHATAASPFVIRRTLRSLSISTSTGRAAVLALRWSRRRGVTLSRAVDRRADGTSWDPETLFHPNHVGRRGDREVEPEVRRRLETAVADLDLTARVRRLAAASGTRPAGRPGELSG